MKKIILISLVSIIFLSGCSSRPENDNDYPSYRVNDVDDYGYEDGYDWASENDVSDFDECQDEFGTSEAEDGCNAYVKDNYSGYKSFSGDECTEDCSGHEAGYEWAEENGIDDVYDCDGNSQSFNEGCEAFVEENY